LTLTHVALFLAAAAIAAPLAKALRIGTVLGYLLAGVLIGPYGLGGLSQLGLGGVTGLGIGDIYSAQAVLHFAEFGVILLLFLIGLELRVTRLWAMRNSIFGAGGLQVGVTGLALGVIGWAVGVAFAPALFMGLALALSSTAFALQVMEENGELTARHGRLGFAILLFQDIAAIPLLALASLFAVSKGGAISGFDATGIVKAALTIAAVVGIGRYVIDQVLRRVAATRLHEAMTASALLTVVVVVLLMEAAGLSASLGAFLAGVLLADSAYRHQIEADIKPFEGLLLGLFFTAIGMSLDLKLVAAKPLLIVALVALLVVVKFVVLYLVGRLQGLSARPARRLAGSLSQGGEFAFVLFGAGAAAGVLTAEQAALGAVLVTLSMVATPAVLLAETRFGKTAAAAPPVYDLLPESERHVIIAGLGRFGQIVSRVLRAKQIPFTALDIDAAHIESTRKFGAKIYFGDASRLDILEAAQAGKARAFVLAIDDVEASIQTAEVVRQNFPQLPIYARARNRNHVHRLMDLGVTVIHRETYQAALHLTTDLLRGLGLTDAQARHATKSFQTQDEGRLIEAYKHYTNDEKLQELALASADELERQFAADAAAQAVAEGAASAAPKRLAATVKVAAE
jgi:monovalent cation:proton antiporter-2 (CPA2) family protein